MKILEEYYGPIRNPETKNFPDDEIEAYLKVEVDGRLFTASGFHGPRGYLRSYDAYQFAKQELRGVIMQEIEKKLFDV